MNEQQFHEGSGKRFDPPMDLKPDTICQANCIRTSEDKSTLPIVAEYDVTHSQGRLPELERSPQSALHHGTRPRHPAQPL